MLTARAAGRRLALGYLLALTAAGAVAVAGQAAPARADSVRDAQQWVLNAVDAPAAWPVTQGQGVLVAVIDSGVEPNVSDLAGSVSTGPNYSGVSTKPSNPDWGMHGTWMASLIAGHGHDGNNGISGVAPRAQVLSIRVLPDKKDPAYAKYEREPSSRGQRALARAINYAVAHRAGVISMSLGYGASSLVVRKALQSALQRGVVVVASSGNSGDTPNGQARAHAPYSFPADYPGVLGVAAINEAGDPANFSSDNLSVQVAAPGVQVPAQGRDGQYWLVSGTSPACALTSGVAALIKSAYPRLSPALVALAITSTAQHRPPGGYDDRVGFGTVDAAAALAAARHLTSYVPGGHGLSPASHFGGGPAAIPPPPVRPRGLSQLVLFCLLAAGCLALTVAAASRLVLGRTRGARPGGHASRSRLRSGRGQFRSGRGQFRSGRNRDRARSFAARAGAAAARAGVASRAGTAARAWRGGMSGREQAAPGGRTPAVPSRRRARNRKQSPAQPGMPDDFASRVLDVTEAIPPGRVMSYRDIADYLGTGGPRQVGRVMALWGGGVAWWRVIHADGSLLAGHEREALRNYLAEGTPMRVAADGRPGRVDMRRARWDGMS